MRKMRFREVIELGQGYMEGSGGVKTKTQVLWTTYFALPLTSLWPWGRCLPSLGLSLLLVNIAIMVPVCLTRMYLFHKCHLRVMTCAGDHRYQGNKMQELASWRLLSWETRYCSNDPTNTCKIIMEAGMQRLDTDGPGPAQESTWASDFELRAECWGTLAR